ncbi:MAG: phosphoribosyltransferase [Pseudomonadota bacterium]
MQPHAFWQRLDPAEAVAPAPWRDRFPARLPDGRVLHLPIRALGESGEGIASLILNQASFAVEAALADALAEALRPLAPEVVVGLPTLGLALARPVAERLGHPRFVALGTSRKFWYEEALSAPMRSITSPGTEKRLFVDPRMVPLLAGRSIALVDDVLSSGASICAGLDVLETIGEAPVAIGAAMLQTERWRERLEARERGLADRVRGVFETPLLRSGPDGWRIAEDADP